jgi:hypothetical protein
MRNSKISKMREKLMLMELPDAVRQAVVATISVPGGRMNAVEKGRWFDLEGKAIEKRVDVFYYRGRFWEHAKFRTMDEHQWPVVQDDPELVEVFPRTKAIVVYE